MSYEISLSYRKRTHRLYSRAKWKTLRGDQLRKQPHCESPHCIDTGVPATVVDHIDPHRGDERKFYSRNNLQSLCKHCHDKFKQSKEKGGAGFDSGCKPDGYPLNGTHSWYERNIDSLN